jgi:hypothetical protein
VLIARRELARRYPLEMPLSRLLCAGKADRQDALAPLLGPRATFEEYWGAFDALSPAEREGRGRGLLHNEPPVIAALLGHLASASHLDRLRAVRVIACLGLAGRFEEKLYALCHDARPEVRSAAVTAISPLGSAVSRHMLHRALDDEDTRVQANAVEAVAENGGEAVAERLIPKLASPDNRVQANAVKALLRLGVREAAETLLRMLGDPNRMQRVSALWVIEHMGLATLVAKVHGMASQDPDPLVRRRAITLARGMPVGAAASSKAARPEAREAHP